MVLVRRGGEWAPADLKMYSDEDELQSLLERDPGLIPGCAGAAVVREMAVPGIGAVDLVAVSGSGEVTLVECKLAKNAEIRRAVVGQILAYASGLAGMPFDEFDGLFRARGGQGLLDAVTAESGPDLDRGMLRSAISDAVSSGRFRLVVAVDAITDELRAIVEYLNEHLSASVTICALELGYFKEGTVELLVPATYGAELAAAKEPPSRSKRRWDSATVLQAADQIPDASERAFVQRMLRHASEHDAQVRGGTGEAPSAGFHYKVADDRRSVWSLWLRDSGPVVALNLGSVRTSSDTAARGMLQEIERAECFQPKLGDDPQMWLSKFPAVPVAHILAEAGVDAAVLRALAAAVRTTEPGGHEVSPSAEL